MEILMALNDECKKLIPKVVYLVEANHAEYQFLWMENSIEAQKSFGATLGFMEHNRQNWDEHSRTGGMQQIGSLDDRPVTVELHFQKINGKQICFYHGCSVVIDYDMINEWLKETFPGIHRTNSTNYSPAK